MANLLIGIHAGKATMAGLPSFGSGILYLLMGALESRQRARTLMNFCSPVLGNSYRFAKLPGFVFSAIVARKRGAD